MQTKIIPRFEASIAPTDTDSINVWLGRSTSLPGAWRIVQMELDLHKGGAVLARTPRKELLNGHVEADCMGTTTLHLD